MESIGRDITLLLHVTKRVESERESSLLAVSVSWETKVNLHNFSWADDIFAEMQRIVTISNSFVIVLDIHCLLSSGC